MAIDSQTSTNTNNPIVPSDGQKSSLIRVALTGPLFFAIWFGLIAGGAELSVLAVRKFLYHQMLFVGPQVVWMTPLSYLLFFVAFGVGLSLVAWQWPKILSLRTNVFLLAFLATFSFLFLYYPRLHKLAILALAAGVAVQTARFSAKHPVGFYRFARRTAVGMIAIVLVLAVTLHGWRWLAEHRALAALPPASAGAPNVVLIVMDTVRAQSLSLYGYDRPTTPRLEQLAARGVKFERAISTAPWTTPSHASMFTGRWPHELLSEWKTMDLRPIDSSYPTIAEVLRERGYLTAGFVSNMDYVGYESGLSRGFTHYEDYPLSVDEVIVSSSLGRFITSNPKLRKLTGHYDVPSRKTAVQVNDEFLSWLSRQEGQRPFFAFLNYFDAHEPYMPPAPFNTMFGSAIRKNSLIVNWRNHQAKREGKQDMTPADTQAELDAYEGSISYLDHQLGLLFDELEKRGALRNTLIIITADHGEQFGEHGLFEHINSLYLPLLHVPLVIIFPSHVPEGTRVSEPVSLKALPATIVDLLSLDNKTFPGTSLARHWEGSRQPTVEAEDTMLSEVDFMPDLFKWWPVSKGNMKSLVIGRYHYIKNGDGKEELYDIQHDPTEKQDVVASAESRSVLEQFRASLASTLTGDRSIGKNSAAASAASMPRLTGKLEAGGVR